MSQPITPEPVGDTVQGGRAVPPAGPVVGVQPFPDRGQGSGQDAASARRKVKVCADGSLVELGAPEPQEEVLGEVLGDPLGFLVNLKVVADGFVTHADGTVDQGDAHLPAGVLGAAEGVAL
jgi:hypothetical protein